MYAETPVTTPKKVAIALMVKTAMSAPCQPYAFPNVATKTEAAGNSVSTPHLITL
ncbi:hypothetical protein RV17_GL001455 [Enterococcus thailandicus]|nr:hypothetical protein RV17_GL001455 [Enterococcus thailandicus]